MSKDPANRDPFTQGGEHGFIGKAVVQYNIVFDDEPQLRDFYKFIKGLKAKYPEERTIGGRIARYLRENTIATQEWDGYLASIPSAGKTKRIDKPTTV
jgi:hypothetical protein